MVEEVFRKIERDIMSGWFSGEDILCVVDDFREEIILVFKGYCDIVNLIFVVM